ncbi:MAG: SDR family oxidoreductase [Candidatus Thiodiazotropha sp. 'RUGA']|nr:SDR family oxidoreductase [Candidatus Thiodiazotropha sp. 'RUGA']
MSNQSVAVVTGANRGLGFETSRQLAQLGRHVVLTARDEALGSAAAEQLLQEGLDVEFFPLDVSNSESISALASYLSDKYDDIDALVNNAGIFPDPPPSDERSSILNADPDSIQQGFMINTLAPLRLCQALIPHMHGEGRIVNVSSGMGQLSDMNGCCPAYRLSKTALNAVTRILADELQQTRIKINSVCPGWVRTRMGGDEATLSVEDGVKGIVWAATLSDDGPSGGFFRQGEAIPW